MLMLLFHLAVQLQCILNNTLSQTDLWFKYSVQKLKGVGSGRVRKGRGVEAVPIKSNQQYKNQPKIIK